ncbi:MAG: hypothetical protein U9Q99_00850 [Nanoarchaeota archaeon]|nr:hypothetical protein [Nanoarchaeota archaeon]
MNKKERGKKALKEILILIVIPLLLIIFINWIGLLFFTLVLLYKIFKIKRRGYFAKDVKGKKLKTKDFFKRWRSGIEGITPLQQARTNLLGTWITISGILAGIIINALVRMEKQWVWIEIILIGSLILVVIQMIGGIQKYWKFKAVDKIQKKFEEEMKKGFKK